MSTWYTDEYAKAVHEKIKTQLAGAFAEITPGYELSHIGVNRDFATDEVRIVLHLQPSIHRRLP